MFEVTWKENQAGKASKDEAKEAEADNIKDQTPQMSIIFPLLPVLRLQQALSLGAVLQGSCMLPFMTN